MTLGKPASVLQVFLFIKWVNYEDCSQMDYMGWQSHEAEPVSKARDSGLEQTSKAA